MIPDQHAGRPHRCPSIRPGQALVIAAISFTALLMLVALAVDIGNLTLQQRRLRQLAEGAALSAAQTVIQAATPDDPPSLPNSGVITTAKLYILKLANIDCDLSSDCVIDHPVGAGPDAGQYVRVTLYRDVPFAFARIFGLPSQRISTTATARGVRPLFSSAAVIALGSGGVQVSGTGNYQVWGGVASYGPINIATSVLTTRNGDAFAGGSIGPGAVGLGTAYANDGDVRRRFPDPIDLAVRTGQLALPTFPSGSFNCGSGSTTIVEPQVRTVAGVPEPNNDPQNVSANRQRVIIRHNVPSGFPPGSYRVDARLNPGPYCSIQIQGGAQSNVDVTFRGGDYFINDFLDATGEAAVNGSGVYIQSQGPISFHHYVSVTDPSPVDPPLLRVNLSGKDDYHDLIFHVISNNYLRVQNLTNSSSFVGTLYAPTGSVEIWSRRSCSIGDREQYLIQRGGSKRGGRLIGAQISLAATGIGLTDRPCGVAYYDQTYDPFGIDPRIDYMIAPSLVPNAP